MGFARKFRRSKKVNNVGAEYSGKSLHLTTRKTKMNEKSYPKMGQSFSRDELVSVGTEHAGLMFDSLADDGIWIWPNARVVLQKQGNRAVVINTI